MYVTNTNAVYALDARSGRLIWSYADPRAELQGAAPNRGPAILGDSVYFVTSDNYLMGARPADRRCPVQRAVRQC